MNHVQATSDNQTQPTLLESKSMRWLLAHDIREPKRLQRLWRYLRKEGVRLQYSIYLLQGNRQHIEGLLDRVRQIIDARTDDVRVYAIGENTRFWGLGKQFEDGGNTLCDDLIDKLRPSSFDTMNLRDEKDKDLSFL